MKKHWFFKLPNKCSFHNTSRAAEVLLQCEWRMRLVSVLWIEQLYKQTKISETKMSNISKSEVIWNMVLLTD